jgi:uncharacterized protein YdeI (YjbR/CyaY-like superfamily)
MRVRSSSENQMQTDPEWVQEFASFLERNGNKKKFQSAKRIFVDTYFENVRNGMHPKEALQNAKSVALCFLLLQR